MEIEDPSSFERRFRGEHRKQWRVVVFVLEEATQNVIFIYAL
jgi:hypothetical protein